MFWKNSHMAVRSTTCSRGLHGFVCIFYVPLLCSKDLVRSVPLPVKSDRGCRKKSGFVRYLDYYDAIATADTSYRRNVRFYDESTKKSGWTSTFLPLRGSTYRSMQD